MRAGTRGDRGDDVGGGERRRANAGQCTGPGLGAEHKKLVLRHFGLGRARAGGWWCLPAASVLR